MEYLLDRINNTPTFCSAKGEVSEPVELYYNLQGVSAITIIFQVINGRSFNGESAKLYVSNSKDGDYTLLKTLSLGAKDIMSYSITCENQGVLGSPLFFCWWKIIVPRIEGAQVKIVCSGR